MGEACGTHGGEETNLQVLARNPEGQIPLGMPRQDGRIILK